MKKFISMLMVLCMLFTIAPMGIVSVSADTSTTPTVLFDMTISTDVDESNTRGYDVTNSGTLGTANVVYGSYKKQTNVPTLGSYTNGSNTIPYLTFEEPTAETVNNVAAVNVQMNTERTETIANKDALTFEVWFREGGFDYRTSGSVHEIFGLNDSAYTTRAGRGIGYPAIMARVTGVGGDTSDANLPDGAVNVTFNPDPIGGSAKLEAITLPQDTEGSETIITDVRDEDKKAYQNNSATYANAGVSADVSSVLDYGALVGTKGTADSSYTRGKWQHLVMVRTWDSTNSKWLIDTYIDGSVVYKTNQTVANMGKTDYSKVYRTATPTAETDLLNFNVVTIGDGYCEDGSGFAGDIADFKIYDGELTYEQIVDSYNEGNAVYNPAVEKSDVIFDMDLSGCSPASAEAAQTLAVTDKSDATIDTTILGYGCINAFDSTDDNYTPTVMEGTAGEETTYKYLRFLESDGEGGYTNTYSQVNVRLNDKTVFDEDVLTVETWFRHNFVDDTNSTPANNSLFAMGDATGSYARLSGEAFGAQFITSNSANNTIKLVPDGVVSRNAVSTHTLPEVENGKWTHLVTTRKWTPTDAADPYGAGTWTMTSYVNGTKYEGTVAATSRTRYETAINLDQFQQYNTPDYLVIGGSTVDNGDQAFAGDIATFKVYRTELDQETVTANYEAGATIYKYGEEEEEEEVIDETAPYFDLEIGKTDDGTLSVTDAKGNGTITLGSSNSSNTHSPIYGKDTSNGVEYLTFGYVETDEEASTSTSMNGNARAIVEFPDTRIVTGVDSTGSITSETFAEGLTMETWVRPMTKLETIGVAFQYGMSTSNVDSNWDMQLRQNSDNIILEGSAHRLKGTNGTSGKLTVTNANKNNLGDWTHIVLTRRYNGQNTDGLATFTSEVYINGVSQGTVDSTQGLGSSNEQMAYTSSYKYLMIGGPASNTNQRSFWGDIADFKVYTYAFDAAKAAANYAAEAPTYDPYGFAPSKGKLFEMDLTACAPADSEHEQTLAVAATEETAGYVNSISYGMHTVQAASDPTNYPLQEPNVKTETVGENTIKYLEFSHLEGEEGAEEWTNKKSSVAVTMKDLNTNIANNDKLAVEMWARSRDFGEKGASDAAGRYNRAFFSYGNNTRTGRSSAFSGWQGSIATAAYTANNFNLRFDGVTGGIMNNVNSREANHGSIANGQDKWTHYFVTREWIADAAATAAANDGDEYGRWQSTLYVNGMEQSTVMSPAAEEAAVTRQDYDKVYNSDGNQQIYNTLLIGNDAYGVDNAFCGDIAAFTLYSGDYSAGDAFVAYMTSAADYGYDVSGDVLNMTFYDQDGIEITSSTEVADVTEVNIKNLMLKNRTSAFVVIAAYEDVEGGKVLSRCEILTAADFETITNGDDTYLVANKSMPINSDDEEEITDLKMFIWESATNIVPVASPHCL